MEKTRENQRVRLTKTLLSNSLIACLKEKQLHDISVRQLCERAEINRTTFYKYFGSPYELLTYIQDSTIEQIEECLRLAGNGQDPLRQMLKWLDENAETSRILLDNTVDASFSDRLMTLSAVKEMLLPILQERFLPEQIDYLYGFVATGGQFMIRSWLNKAQREPPETIALLIEAAVSRL